VDFLKTLAVARELGTSENYVRRRADAGVLPVAAKLSDGTRLFSPVDVERERREREARRVAQQPQPAPVRGSGGDNGHAGGRPTDVIIGRRGDRACEPVIRDQ
jgi:hypothetical protein